MARLTTKARNALPDSAFAGPNRTYPVNDPSHAANAKARAAQHASPALEKKVDARANKVLGKRHRGGGAPAGDNRAGRMSDVSSDRGTFRFKANRRGD